MAVCRGDRGGGSGGGWWRAAGCSAQFGKLRRFGNSYQGISLAKELLAAGTGDVTSFGTYYQMQATPLTRKTEAWPLQFAPRYFSKVPAPAATPPTHDAGCGLCFRCPSAAACFAPPIQPSWSSLCGAGDGSACGIPKPQVSRRLCGGRHRGGGRTGKHSAASVAPISSRLLEAQGPCGGLPPHTSINSRGSAYIASTTAGRRPPPSACVLHPPAQVG